MSTLMLVSRFKKIPEKTPLIAGPLCNVGLHVYLPCSGYFASMTLKV